MKSVVTTFQKITTRNLVNWFGKKYGYFYFKPYHQYRHEAWCLVDTLGELSIKELTDYIQSRMWKVVWVPGPVVASEIVLKEDGKYY